MCKNNSKRINIRKIVAESRQPWAISQFPFFLQVDNKGSKNKYISIAV